MQTQERATAFAGGAKEVMRSGCAREQIRRMEGWVMGTVYGPVLFRGAPLIWCPRRENAVNAKLPPPLTTQRVRGRERDMHTCTLDYSTKLILFKQTKYWLF